MSIPKFDNGIHRPSPKEAILVRDGHVVRRVLSVIEEDRREVVVSRTLGAETREDHDELFERHVAELEDDGNAVTRCSFCEKGREEVPTLIAGPVCYICSECVTLCQEILD